MEVSIKTLAPAQWSADVLIAPVFEHEPGAQQVELILTQLSADLKQAAPWLATHTGLCDTTGKKGECFVLHAPTAPIQTGQTGPSRVLLVGLGKRARLVGEAACLKALRTAMGEALHHCRELHLAHVAISLPDVAGLVSMEDSVRETACGALLALYRQTAFKSDGQSTLARDPDPVELTILSATTCGDDLMRALKEGIASARAVNQAKDLINMPSNRLYPEIFATMAVELAKGHGDISCEVLDEAEMASLGMGALLAVGAGSARKPRFIVLEYAPAGHAQEHPLVFVGKGITFDSGGISLKPSAGMERMKGDMGGAAAVFGLFTALAELKPAKRVVGILPCAENMPDGTATRPGDVVTTLSGKTVEIINTDAEGRLVLCDALTYAQNRWHPAVLLDVATLTGACAVALGAEMAGLFCRDPLLTERLRGISDRVGEPFWPLPLNDDYFDKLKSETADFMNSGPREGGACVAAIFLAQFVQEGVRWAHLDIAGTSFSEKKGGTGYAVRTFIDYVIKP